MSRTKKGKKPPGYEYWSKRPARTPNGRKGYSHDSGSYCPQLGGYLQALSRMRLTHADKETLALSAARWYFSSRSSLTLTVSQRRSPFSTTGLPLWRFSISELCTNK